MSLRLLAIFFPNLDASFTDFRFVTTLSIGYLTNRNGCLFTPNEEGCNVLTYLTTDNVVFWCEIRSNASGKMNYCGTFL